MSGVNVLLFTECEMGIAQVRASGAYRLATELRNNGYTVQTIEYAGFFSFEDHIKLIDKFVGTDTFVIGFSSTFFSKAPQESKVDYNLEREMYNRLKYIFNHEIEARSSDYHIDNSIIKDIIEYAKSKNSKLKIVYGGDRARLFKAPYVDCFIAGYGEKLILDYLNYLRSPETYRLDNVRVLNSGSIALIYDKNNDKNNFNTSQIVWDKSDYVFQNEVLPIEISRGCIFKCKFCSYPLNGKKKLDYIKDIDVLADEFNRNYELYGTTDYIIGDDTFNDSTFKLQVVGDVLNKINKKINFCAYIRLDLLAAHEEQIDILNELGIRQAFFGIESTTDSVLKTIGKGTSFKKILSTLTTLTNKWNHVGRFGSFVFGLPGETTESLNYMKDWIVNDALNYLTGVKVYPLGIRNKYSESSEVIWMSEIDTNYDKYGYTYDTTQKDDMIAVKWFNKKINSSMDEMLKFTHDIAVSVKNDNRFRQSGFYAMGYKNYGISYEELLTTPFVSKEFKDIKTKVFYKFIERITQYKHNLLL